MHSAEDIASLARGVGMTDAGVVSLDRLLRSLSYLMGGGPLPSLHGRSVLVVGLAHPPAEPGLDAWQGPRGTPGNRKLKDLSRRLIANMRTKFAIQADILPYQPSQGGVFIKDAAVLSGLGSMGRNNLVIHPSLGPRIRWRGLILSEDVVEAPRKTDFDPCRICSAPCRKACPKDAFESGTFDVARCRIQMEEDEARPDDDGRITYCRACETACIVGWDDDE